MKMGVASDYYARGVDHIHGSGLARQVAGRDDGAVYEEEGLGDDHRQDDQIVPLARRPVKWHVVTDRHLDILLPEKLFRDNLRRERRALFIPVCIVCVEQILVLMCPERCVKIDELDVLGS